MTGAALVVLLAVIGLALHLAANSPALMRHVAAWLLARALFIECLTAERDRLRLAAEAFRVRREIEYGLRPAQVEAEAE